MSLQVDALSVFENDVNKRSFIAQVAYERQIIRAFDAFRAAGIEPILIKGWSIARHYPADKKRLIGDIDLCVRGSQFNQARRLLKSTPVAEIKIDLHDELRHLDKLSFDELFQDSAVVDLQNAEIRVLRHEDNFRVTAVHWLTDGGANREKLWDIFYLIENRPPDFDWGRCLNAAGKTRRQWFITMIALAHRHLKLNVEDLPIKDEVLSDKAIPKWLIAALEKEWSNPTKLHRMDKLLYDWQSLKEQLKMRFPPNPITASVDTEAPFDESSRLPYQIADIGLRFIWGFKRLTAGVLERLVYLRPRD
jgi:hypothetical protein